MQLIIDKLRTYAETLNKRYEFNFSIDDPIFNDNEKEILAKTDNIFHRNVLLKDIICSKANGRYDNHGLNSWIINSWGGIKSFKINTDTQNPHKIKRFAEELSKGELSKDSFSTISSLSKIASFVNPDEYVIYDARVAYALNWLMLTCGDSQAAIKYFPVPQGRNTKLTDLNITTLIYLKHIDKYHDKPALFYSHKRAYFELCKLIKEIAPLVFDDQHIKPYYLEMLLFAIADNEVHDDLKKSVSIRFNDLNSEMQTTF